MSVIDVIPNYRPVILLSMTRDIWILLMPWKLQSYHLVPQFDITIWNLAEFSPLVPQEFPSSTPPICQYELLRSCDWGYRARLDLELSMPMVIQITLVSNFTKGRKYLARLTRNTSGPTSGKLFIKVKGVDSDKFWFPVWTSSACSYWLVDGKFFFTAVILECRRWLFCTAESQKLATNVGFRKKHGNCIVLCCFARHIDILIRMLYSKIPCNILQADLEKA